MKLKEEFITQTIDGTQFIVSRGGTVFDGIVRNNETAALIVDLLKDGAARDEIVDKLFAAYDAPREVIAKDVDGVLDKLRSISAIEE